MRSLCIIAVLCTLAVSASPPAIARESARSARIRDVITQKLRARVGYRWRRSGWTADAFLLEPAPGQTARWVYKRIKPTIPSGELMTRPDARMRHMFREMTVWAIGKLRSAPAFAAHRHLLPETKRSGRFALLQALGQGKPYDALSTRARTVADGEVAAIKKAAQRALPGVEIDVNKGNLLFDKRGRATSLFDPAGGWWARLLRDKVRGDRRGFIVDRGRGPFMLANSVALRATGGDLAFGDAWIVANVQRKAAFVVKHGFKMAYEKPHSRSNGRPLYELLGPPREDEHQVGGGSYVQRFEHGSMRWSPRDGTQVVVDPTP